MGKVLDVPVWRLLGGKCRDKIRLYSNGWYMEARASGELQGYVDAAKRVVDDGFTAMKFDPFMGNPTLNDAILPKHIDAFRDGPIVERVAVVREAVGPDIDIIVEVHGWFDVGICGSIAEIHKIAAHAETYHIGIAPHNCNGPVATAASVHADFATSNFVIQEWFPYELPEHYGLVDHPFVPTHKGGYLDLPERPGLGVELTELALSKNTYKALREAPSSQ